MTISTLPILESNLTLIDFEARYPVIGEGSSRKVFLLSNEWVAKVPLNEIGILQNKKEVSVYKEYKDSDYGSLLTPCFPIEDAPFIIMRRTNPLPLLKTQTIAQFLEDNYPSVPSYDKRLLEVFIRKAGLHMDDIYLSVAWGILNEKLLLLDYGCSHELFQYHYAF